MAMLAIALIAHLAVAPSIAQPAQLPAVTVMVPDRGAGPIMLPESAVMSDSDGIYVYIINHNDAVVRREVVTGPPDDRGVPILRGLDGDERVVEAAGPFLNPGERVRPELVPGAVRTGETSARVRVVALSEEPPVGSGIVATFVRVTGRSAGVDRDYLLPFMRAGQPRPGIGASCTLFLRPFEYQGHVGPELESVNGGEAIARYRCDGEAEVVTGV